MNDCRKRSLERRARVFSALAHPSRLLIVEMLEEKNRSVTELTDAVGSDMSTVSRHLSVLRSAGIIGSERHGNIIEYSLRTPCITRFFECVEQVICQSDGSELS